jgi:hypothetical protein
MSCSGWRTKSTLSSAQNCAHTSARFARNPRVATRSTSAPRKRSPRKTAILSASPNRSSRCATALTPDGINARRRPTRRCHWLLDRMVTAEEHPPRLQCTPAMSHRSSLRTAICSGNSRSAEDITIGVAAEEDMTEVTSTRAKKVSVGRRSFPPRSPSLVRRPSPAVVHHLAPQEAVASPHQLETNSTLSTKPKQFRLRCPIHFYSDELCDPIGFKCVSRPICLLLSSPQTFAFLFVLFLRGFSPPNVCV